VVGERGAATLRGEMIWFNNVKDLGFIATATGERLSVQGSDFDGGGRPQGRCGGRVVAFRVIGEGPNARAVDVVFVDEPPPRRARSHRSTAR
jgi:cold shock CspA family protein